ncbi:MAG TPA: ectonucleotide pyrophosphatase/phosphodiesterase [Candidatus Polarisedimenticolia bacterium]|nr:ectonucleotide pyrophosphatase/phosphodiesterase [Candidatus Polarisedimenticolia bacterium]
MAALCVLLSAARPAPPADSILVLISIDGMRYDYPERARAGTFSNLAAGGVRARRLIPPFPASTFPSHATLATGCYPERHGILNNRFLDRDRGEFDRSEDPGWLECEPLWVTAEKQGIRSAVLNWIGSYGAWRGTAASLHASGYQSLTDRESVRRILAWLDLPPRDRPGMILAYFTGVDHAGHAEGPDSPEVDRRVLSVDRTLKLLLTESARRGLSERLNLMVVADHGMAAIVGRVDPGSALARAGIRHRLLPSGGTANLYLGRAGDRSKAQALLGRLTHLEVYPGPELPRDLRYGFPSRTGDLVLLTSPGYEIGREREETSRGMHGFRGTEPSMAGIFYARGPAFVAGSEIDRLEAVDVAPLACAVLGIPASPDTQGRVPAGILRNFHRPVRKAPRPSGARP